MKHKQYSANQNGFAILEALISFIVLGVGLLVLINFNTAAMQSSGDARARIEAMNLAQNKAQELRSYLDNDTDVGGDWEARLKTLAQANAESISGNNATYSRYWTVTDNGRLVNIVVNVDWQDRDGSTQSYALESEIYDVDPREAARVLHTAISSRYDQTVTSPSDPYEADTSDLDQDREADTGTWNADTDLGLTNCQDGSGNSVACSTINYYYRLTIGGEVDKSGSLGVTLPNPQVSTASSSGAVCDFGNTAAYKQANKAITWNSSTESILVTSITDPNGLPVVLFQTEPDIKNVTTILYFNSDGTIDADLSATVGDYDIEYQECSGTNQTFCSGTTKTVTAKVTLNDGYYVCYAYFQELLDGDLDRNGTIDNATEQAAADGDYGWTGAISFTLSNNTGVFCFPINGVNVPSLATPSTNSADYDDTAFGAISFDKYYEKIVSDQTLFLQIASQTSVCPSQL